MLYHLAESFVFVACELLFFFLVFSPFLLARKPAAGTVELKPFGPIWILFGAVCAAFILAALARP